MPFFFRIFILGDSGKWGGGGGVRTPKSLKSTSGKRLSSGVCIQMILSGFQPTFILRIQFRLIFRFFIFHPPYPTTLNSPRGTRLSQVTLLSTLCYA